ncbi:MAG TPA: hypothetical protein DD400_01380 [Rhodospirillaceae bacterium]|nr:hypothetical protein [Rhodospirillaceae bacterium]
MLLLRQAALFSLLLLVTSCGFSPVYGPHKEVKTSVAKAMNNVAINNIPNRHGQILRNHLIDRLYTNGRPIKPTTQLHVNLTVSERNLGIQKDATASRSQLTIWAPYSLKNKRGQTLFEGKAHSVVSYSKLDAQYGTVTAQRNAYARALREISEQIVNRLSLYFAERGKEKPMLGYPSFLVPQELSAE